MLLPIVSIIGSQSTRARRSANQFLRRNIVLSYTKGRTFPPGATFQSDLTSLNVEDDVQSMSVENSESSSDDGTKMESVPQKVRNTSYLQP